MEQQLNAKSMHVVPNPKGGWSVRQSGAERAARNFGTQAEAVRYGRELARRDRTEFYVHRQDGTIRERDSYRPDPASARNTR